LSVFFFLLIRGKSAMIVEIEEYLAMEGETLPYTTGWGFTVTNLDVDCVKCGKHTTENKYRFNEYKNSLEIIAVGVCHDCNVITTGKPTRIYSDNRASWRNSDGTWVQSKIKYDNWFVRLKKWLKK